MATNSGWNGSRGSSTPIKPKVTARKTLPVSELVVGTVLVAAAIGCYFAFFSNSEKPQTDVVAKERGKIREVTPAAVPKYRVEQTPEGKPHVKVQTRPKPQSLRDPSLSEDARERLYEKQLAEEKLPTTTNRAFRTGLEQVVSWVFTTRLGDAPPPLPEISDFDLVHFQEIMDNKNVVTEKDSDATADAKEVVDYVKKELKKYVDEGGDPQDFLEYYHNQLQEAHEQVKTAQEQMDKVLETEPEIAVDYLKKVNKSLAEKGIRGVVITERDRERYGLPPETAEENESGAIR